MSRYSSYPAYDDSGFPKHWKAMRLRFAVTLNPSKNEISLSDSELISFVPMDAVGEYGGIRLDEDKEMGQIGSGYTYFCDNDVVVAKITPCFENGKGAIAKGLTNGCAFGTTELHVLRVDLDLLDPDFLFYLTVSDWFRDLGESEMYGAGGQKRVPEDFIKDLVTGIPPQDEQQAIVGFLDYKTAQIDSLIAKKQLLLDKLTEQRTAVISDAVARGLDPSVSMKNSGVDWVGEIPAHWTVPILGYIAEVRGGVTKGRKLPSEETVEVPYLRVANVQDGFIDLSHVTNIEILVTELERYSLQRGDVLMNEGGDNDKLGRGAVWKGEIDPCLHQNHVFAVRPRIPEFSDWLALLTQSGYAKFYFFTTAKQSTNLASISSSNIKKLPVLLPPEAERKEIIDHVRDSLDKLKKQRERVIQVIERLKEYRAALITNAVAGKIDVRDFCPVATKERKEVANG